MTPPPEKAGKKQARPVISLADMAIDEALVVLNKKYGAGSFVIASKAKGTEIRYTSTGAWALDFALGGGFPKNRFIELHGNYSSYKSTLSLMALARYQQENSKNWGIYVDLEHSFDRSYAAALGVDLSRLLLFDPNTGEESVDGMMDALELPLPLFVIIDSLAAMRPTKELEADMEQQFMGQHARLVGRAMGVLNSRLKRQLVESGTPPVTVVVLNQLRESMASYGNPETTPGGKAKDFYYSVTIRLAARNSEQVTEKRTKNGESREVRIAQEVAFKVKKNKTAGPQHEEGSFVFYERDTPENAALTIDNVTAAFKYGLFYDVIKLSSSGVYTYKNQSSGKAGLMLKKLRALPADELEELYFEILAAITPPKKVKLGK